MKKVAVLKGVLVTLKQRLVHDSPRKDNTATLSGNAASCRRPRPALTRYCICCGSLQSMLQ